MADAGGAATSRRPADTPFKQQRLRAWQPIFTPHWVISCFVFIAAVFIPIGALVVVASGNVVEVALRYDDLPNLANCRWSRGATWDENTDCIDETDAAKCGMMANLLPYDPVTGTGCPRDWQKGKLNNMSLDKMKALGGRNATDGLRLCDPMCQDVVEFEITETMASPVYMYYKLSNFYQNHRRYAKSRSDDQLAGGAGSSLDDCKPLMSPGEIGNDSFCVEQYGVDCAHVNIGTCPPNADNTPGIINDTTTGVESCPNNYVSDRTAGGFQYSACGLVAWSQFNDSFDLEKCADPGTCSTWNGICKGEAFGREDGALLQDGDPTCEKAGIAWAADREKKFQAPEGGPNILTYKGFSRQQVVDGQLWSGGQNGDRAVLPFFLNGWYLFEPYHSIPAALDEDFMVWMRTASLSTFRKLYRKINIDLQPGKYRLRVRHRFDVSLFGGEKFVVLSTLSWIGGKNYFLGGAYITVGCLCFLLAVGFAVKHIVFPTDRAKAMQSYNQAGAAR